MAASHSPEFIALCDKAKARIKQLNPSEVAGVLKSNPNALLVDVREKDEFDSGHLNDALHISRGVLEMNIHKHAKDKESPIVVYCKGGNRGALAAASLQDMGFKNVLSIDGGFSAVEKQQILDLLGPEKN